MRAEELPIDSSVTAVAGQTAAETSQLTVEVVSTLEALRGLRADYERLQRSTGNTLPFSLHEWHLCWCDTFLEDAPGIRDRPMIHVLRTAAGTCIGIVPLILTERRIGPFTVRSFDALGSDPGITEIRTPLIEPGREAQVVRALQRMLAASRGWDWVVWRGLDDALAAALAGAPHLRWQLPLLDYVLDLPSSWEELRAGLKRNIRESLRHCYNSLKRDGHAFSLRVAADAQAIEDALDRFLVLHQMRAGVTGTVNHPNRFSSALVRWFLYQVCRRLAETGSARVFELVIGGEAVASRIGFIVGDSLYLYYSGFDPRWGKYSVMTTTMAEAIKYAIAQGLTSVNLSPGTDVGKTRWGPREIPYREAIQTAGTLHAGIARLLYEQARSQGPLAQWLRNWFRRGRRNWG
jgi:CelD/BcsL family acetyltransferase involved in cellulose biosynthesis